METAEVTVINLLLLLLLLLLHSSPDQCNLCQCETQVRLCGKAWLLAVRPHVYELGTFTE